MINQLTKKQVKKLAEYKDLYLNKFFNNKKEADFNEIKNFVDYLYKLSGLKTPITILVNSPYEAQIAANLLKYYCDLKKFQKSLTESQVWSQVGNQVGNQVESQVESQVGNQVGDQVGSQVWSQVGNQVGNQVWSQVGDQVWSQVESQVGNQVWSQVWSQVGSQVESQVGNQVRNQVRNQVGNQVWSQVRNQVWSQVGSQVESQVGSQVGDQVESQVGDQVGSQVESQNFQIKEKFLFSYYLSCWENSWISFYEFFNAECFKLENKEFNTYKKICDLNIFDSIQLENFCIVSKNAANFSRNSNFQLHSTEGPAIIFPGQEYQYKLWYIQGINVSEELFNKLYSKKYTFEDWIGEKNEEIKSLVLAFYEEKFGGEFVFRFLSKHLKEIDNYVDKKDKQYLKGTVKSMNIGVYTLFKGNVNNTIVAYVRCYCPSTDRMFFLGVHPDFTNAKDAIASLCQIPAKLKDNLLSISRQGEIFSFNFDEIGTEILKNQELTKEDYQNVVSLTGNEYFNKIKFEF